MLAAIIATLNMWQNGVKKLASKNLLSKNYTDCGRGGG